MVRDATVNSHLVRLGMCLLRLTRFRLRDRTPEDERHLAARLNSLGEIEQLSTIRNHLPTRFSIRARDPRLSLPESLDVWAIIARWVLHQDTSCRYGNILRMRQRRNRSDAD